jgi:hypothetical protein
MQRMSMDEECAGCEMSAKMIEKYTLKLKRSQKTCQHCLLRRNNLQQLGETATGKRLLNASSSQITSHKSQVTSHKSHLSFGTRCNLFAELDQRRHSVQEGDGHVHSSSNAPIARNITITNTTTSSTWSDTENLSGTYLRAILHTNSNTR